MADPSEIAAKLPPLIFALNERDRGDEVPEDEADIGLISFDALIS
jgi:hypothetical protein